MSDHHNKNGSAASEPGIPAETLTAYALDQLSGAERELVERFLSDPEQTASRALVAETRHLAADLPAAMTSRSAPDRSSALRDVVINQLDETPAPEVNLPAKAKSATRRRTLSWSEWLALGGLACVLIALCFPAVQTARESARRVAAVTTQQSGSQSEAQSNRTLATSDQPAPITRPVGEGYEERPVADPAATVVEAELDVLREAQAASRAEYDPVAERRPSTSYRTVAGPQPADPKPAELATTPDFDGFGNLITTNVEGQSWDEITDGERPVTYPHAKAWKKITEQRNSHKYAGQGRGRTSRMDLYGDTSGGGKRIVVVTDGRGLQELSKLHETEGRSDQQSQAQSLKMLVTPRIVIQEEDESKLGIDLLPGTEQYAAISDNPFLSPLQAPLSTFSIDVDTASYANVRRFLTGGSLPPADAVRIEELINYFRYDYPQPKEGEAFSVTMESAECPWQPSHQLLRVGLKGKDIHRGQRPQSNLVFLLDVSGSMADEDKLPLLKTAMQMFTRELGENDRVSIVTYAGEAGLRLPPTRGHEQETIIAAIESLSSGGSTNGSAGIELAYEQAAAYFVPGGTNRVILCTDGDLNVGVTDDEALVRLIKQKATGGTFLTVLGFGEGNLKDAKMERLADNGNGLYAYIDSVREARKVLVEQMTGSTITIAKDVKIQIEFNPAAIASYRLIGYENRVLAAEDFNDDAKDAGEIGAGHTVTALYELVPAGAEVKPLVPTAKVDPLKYQGVEDRGQRTGDRENESRNQPALTDAAKSGELLTLKLRYKQPDGKESKLLEHPLKDRGGKFNAASKDLQFAAAVASFGMILRGSEHRGQSNLAAVSEIAGGAIGQDEGGYRSEFLDLVRQAQALGAK